MKDKNQDKNTGKDITRRKFIKSTTAAVGAFSIVPSHVLARSGQTAPSDKLNIACVGAGGKGRSDIAGVSTDNVVAICDVDDTQMAGFLDWANREQRTDLVDLYEKAHKYQDFRVMLEKEKSIDAVVISTPDHTHAVIAMAAIKMGKHVFCQKPLTHTVKEARMLAEAAKKYNVTTQMGNQGHAGEGGRLINEWIWDGAIGDVREVHTWTNRPIWPQGINAPTEIPSKPSTLNWDVWLGPAPYRHYHPAYCPFNWRGWYDFGTGVVGDMGAHIFDHPFWALKLGPPSTISASSTRMTEDSFPLASTIHYTFPARDNMPPVKMTWFDGGITPPRPEELEPGRRIGDSGGGVIFIGDKGKLMCSVYGNNPRLIPETRMAEYTRPAKTIPRSPGIHTEWVEACKAGKKSTTDFSYAGALTEMMLLGNVALRTQRQNTILEWDSEKMEITNLPEANQYLHKDYRTGWYL
ncbi:MAG: Gfo/Idh/MocA family oxidoreductase [bacterium]|nr:Gfo/Idh/MocA family oxidoreductase [bacterium]